MNCVYGDRKHITPPETLRPAAPGQPDEVLIADARAGLTPSDMVDRKLLYMLRSPGGTRGQMRLGGP